LPPTARSPAPKSAKIVHLTNTALSHYNALTVAVNQRMSHGLQLYIECNLWTNLGQSSNRNLKCGNTSFAPRHWFHPPNRSPRAIFESGLVSRVAVVSFTDPAHKF
jgi:hypothetical protein